MIDALIDAAERRGYHIRWHKGGPKAAWIQHTSTISVRVGMTDTETLCSLAHELGHALYGHPAGHCPRNERVAEEFAASLLVDPHAYVEAELLFDPHSGAIAHELGVTIHIIETWQKMTERTPA
ncbi:ImmA/IrrE family metallo-endopeptidase [Corynebacterium belfantii]|uniref:ImmA/IrrE family metallo-endopeptidase n=1 Tax=Corynebacterium belfantii TaxID=2014537 RepID=UPI0018D3C056|nr:ImmA/IrrE family metallo-endopeptidase [Corynebacterium belfantii]MBG9333136.1 ImmA/IrrE family metallo-endopeptidase [Corynebacterium belfantii]